MAAHCLRSTRSPARLLRAHTTPGRGLAASDRRYAQHVVLREDLQDVVSALYILALLQPRPSCLGNLSCDWFKAQTLPASPTAAHCGSYNDGNRHHDTHLCTGFSDWILCFSIICRQIGLDCQISSSRSEWSCGLRSRPVASSSLSSQPLPPRAGSFTFTVRDLLQLFG